MLQCSAWISPDAVRINHIFFESYKTSPSGESILPSKPVTSSALFTFASVLKQNKEDYGNIHFPDSQSMSTLVPVVSEAQLIWTVTIWYIGQKDSWRNWWDSSMFQKILASLTANQELDTFLDCGYPWWLFYYNPAPHPGTKSMGKKTPTQ
jgi:hypothetical protein